MPGIEIYHSGSKWRAGIRGGPRLGWMDSLKEALGTRGMTVQAVQQCAKNRKEWRTMVHICS